MRVFAYIILVSLFGIAKSIDISDDNSKISMTIYNSNLAFVHETRESQVPKGRSKLIYRNVPSSFIATSVIPNFKGIDITLYSQNYEYDLINLKSMLKKSISKEIYFYPNDKNSSLKRGILLNANSPLMVKEDKSQNIISLNKSTQVIFPKIPKNMITSPSLIWNIKSPKAGKLGIDLQYLTKGLSWKSDYVLNLNTKKRKMNLLGWISVNNNSGVEYKRVKLSCLAGDINRVNHIVLYRTLSSPKVKEESFSGYHLYKIPFRVTLKNKETKQIRFLEKRDIKYRSFGKAEISRFEYRGVEKLKFTKIIEFDNKKSNSLGVALPAGRVRIYAKDKEGETHFVGESDIANTPAGENIKLTLGTLFDVTGEKRTTKFISREGYKDIESTYTIHNRGDKNIILKIDENIPTYGNSIQLYSSCSGKCSVKKLSAFVREFTIRLKAKESYRFTSEFQVIN